MFTQHVSCSLPSCFHCSLTQSSASSGRTNYSTMPRPPPLSVPTSPVSSNGNYRNRISVHEILDSTTLEVGFDHTCLEGLTADLLYSPIDAFTQSCWDILFPESRSQSRIQPQPQSPQTVVSGPPSYTPSSGIYTISEASSSQSTIRLGDAESSIRFVPTTYFWDDSEDEADDEAESEEEASSLGDDDSEGSSSSGFSHSDAIKDHPTIDMNFTMGESLFLHDLSSANWKSSFVSWENSLPVSVDLRGTPISNGTQKSGRIAAIRAKIPILPFKSSTTVHNPWL
ncbi:hypothetical protein AX15_002453 [Amanita polypyramis BW_CC]|nr:hypothetical protein AX15_002453 [Amanita polypyramis BW_CC]